MPILLFMLMVEFVIHHVECGDYKLDESLTKAKQSRELIRYVAKFRKRQPHRHRERLHVAAEKQLQTPKLDVTVNTPFPKTVKMRSNQNTNVEENLWRNKRFAYEDTHEWPKDDSLDYDFDEDGETEELTFWQEIGRNWQTVFVRAIFLFSALLMLLMIICCCCSIWCRVCCQSLKQNCFPCGGFLDILTSFYEDPMYKKAKDLAELLGLKLDYATYLQIKEKFELQGTGSYNPLGLPYMQ